jgi:hypothetical protein
MNKGQTFVVDFVVKGDSPDVMKMVLVEERDWSEMAVCDASSSGCTGASMQRLTAS